YIEYAYANGVTHTSIAIPQTTPPYATEQLLPENEQKKIREAATKPKKVPDEGWRNGVRFEGSDGWIEITRGRVEASHPELLNEPLPENAMRLYKSDDHM